VTGWGQPKDRRRTVEAGFDAHLVKPVDQNELLKTLFEIASTGGETPARKPGSVEAWKPGNVAGH
jgi:CheY-like chemotaxis protein